MLKFIVKRIIWMIPVTLGVVFLVFAINHFSPGSPMVNREEFGLDQPFITQYINYLVNLAHGDLGLSYSSKRPVATELFDRLPETLTLGLLSMGVTLVVGIPLGIVSATRHQTALDHTISSIAIFLAAIPSFWFALVGMVVFCFKLKWLPASGLYNWTNYILPVTCLSLSPIANVVRMTRSSMLEVVRQDYIRTARAKGLAEKVVTRKHALKNALIPVITVIGVQLSTIMGGSILIEAIFSIPGIGYWMNEAVSTKNTPVIQGGSLMIALFVSLVNLVVDIAYAYVDPRIRGQFSGRNKKAKKKASAV